MEGGKVLSPKMPIPGVGYLAICEDTEGISFGIIQYDRNAK
jgi:predicted enzyme related to lactoylglutathione lyase